MMDRPGRAKADARRQEATNLRIGLAIAALLAAAVSSAAAQQKNPAPAQSASKPPIVCPTIFRPVCGLDKSGRQLNYDNECLAKAAGATRIDAGLCIADVTVEETDR